MDLVLGERLDRALDDVFATRPGQQVGLGPRQLDRGRQQVHPVGRLDDRLRGVEPLGEDVVHRELDVFRVDAEGERQTGLWIEVDDEDRVTQLDESSTDRGHRGGLGDAALLVGDREGHRAWSGHRLHHARPGWHDRGDTCLLGS